MSFGIEKELRLELDIDIPVDQQGNWIGSVSSGLFY